MADLEHLKINYAREQLVNRERKWLEKSGWTYTSSTPGCYWMFTKEWDGKTFLVSHDVAARIQGIWDSEADYKAHPENYKD